LPSGGRIVISELLVNDEKTGPPAAALMSLNMLVETVGRNYTAAEYEQWLHAAGFMDVQTVTFEAPGERRSPRAQTVTVDVTRSRQLSPEAELSRQRGR
jgi:hypothetical protein